MIDQRQQLLDSGHPPADLHYDPDRERRWVAHFLGGCVIVRHCAVPAPGEELTEYPPTHELTRDEWVAKHATEYGLDVDGQPLAGAP